LKEEFIKKAETANKKTRRISAQESAMYMLDYKAYTISELKVKLASKGYKNTEIAAAIQFLVDAKILDDELYAKAFIKTSLEKGRGGRRIAYELKKKGIPTEMFSDDMDELSTSDEYLNRGVEICLKILRMARLDNNSLNDPIVKAKLQAKMNRKLVYQGYEYGIIRDIMIEAMAQIKASFENGNSEY
jgi:regulatory protein